MAPVRRVSDRQLEILVDFIEAHRDIAMGRYSGGPLAYKTATKEWKNIALTLNSSGDGTTKSWDQWRRYWIELKAKVKNKAADSRRMAGDPGGGCRLQPLSKVEERVFAVVGHAAVEGLPAEQIPLDREVLQLRRCLEKIKKLRKESRSKDIESRRLSGGRSLSPPSEDCVPWDEKEPDSKFEMLNTVDSEIVFTEERNTQTSPNIFRAESPLQSTSTSSTETGHQERERRPMRLNAIDQPDLINHNSTTVHIPFVSPTKNDADTLKRKNILIEREQQEELYLYRRSILDIEKEIALEKLRHMKEMNRVKELSEAEMLDHQRAINQLALRRASESLI